MTAFSWRAQSFMAIFLSLNLVGPLGGNSAAAKEINWPKAPFKPTLYHTAKGSEKLCKTYEQEIRSDYFVGYYKEGEPLPETDDLSRMPVIEPMGLNEVPGLSDAGEYPQVYYGDITGNGVSEFSGWKNDGGYGYTAYLEYFRLFRITPDKLARFKGYLEGAEDNSEFYFKVTEDLGGHNFHVFTGDRTDPRDHPVDLALSEIATDAYRMVDGTVVREFEGRLYADVPVPAFDPTERVLLSYDEDMRPRAECVVKTKKYTPNQWVHREPYRYETELYQSGPLAKLYNSSRKMSGVRPRCGMGTSSPFFGHEIFQAGLRHSSLYFPWRGIVDRREQIAKSPGDLFSDRFSFKSFSPDADPKAGHWDFNAFEYYWRAEDPYNRRNSALFDQHAGTAIDQLTVYYLENFDVTEVRARRWAGYYVYYLQASVFDVYGYYEIETLAKEMSEGSVSDDAFIKLAAPHLRKSQGVPVWAYYKALQLAVGTGAPLEVLQALIIRGAGQDGDGNTILPLINSVDHPKVLVFLLAQGANVDRPNGFGKTALMMAAHMNQIDTLKQLLNAGADPNAMTLLEFKKGKGFSGADCLYANIKHRERTALMYAAENASLEIFEILIEAGADPKAQDSKGRSVSDYLEMNKTMSVQDLEKAGNLLSVD